MLFILSTPNAEKFELAARLAGENKKALLLISDGVYLGRPAAFDRLEAHDWDEIHADKKAVADRSLEMAGGCQVAEMTEIVDLALEHRKVVHL